jgi:hypothetical protein
MDQGVDRGCFQVFPVLLCEHEAQVAPLPHLFSLPHAKLVRCVADCRFAHALRLCNLLPPRFVTARDRRNNPKCNCRAYRVRCMQARTSPDLFQTSVGQRQFRTDRFWRCMSKTLEQREPVDHDSKLRQHL